MRNNQIKRNIIAIVFSNAFDQTCSARFKSLKYDLIIIANMNMKYKSLDLIVSTYNNPYVLMKIISSLESGTLQPQNLHIADDGSTEDNVQLIKSRLSTFRGKNLYHWHEDKGFRKSKILNQAIRSSNAEYIVFRR